MKMILIFFAMLLTSFAVYAQDAEVQEYPKFLGGMNTTHYTIFGYLEAEDVVVIRYDGEFAEGSGKVLNSFLSNIKPDILEIHSDGGFVRNIFSAGKTILDNDIKIRINKGDYCASTCAFLSLFSSHIQIDGQLAFHSPYREAIYTDETLQDVYTGAAVMAASMTEVFYDAGWPLYFYYEMLKNSSPETLMVFTDTDEFESYRMTDPVNDYTSPEYEFTYELLTFEEIVEKAKIQLEYND